MRVGVYVSRIRPESGGGHTLLTDLLGALAETRTTHAFEVLHLGDPPVSTGSPLSFVRLPDPVTPADSTLDATARQIGVELIWFPIPEYLPVTLPYFATVWDLEHRNQPHFPEVSVTGWLWEQRELFYRSTLPKATRIIVGTKEGMRQVERYYGVPADRIDVVPLPTPRFSPADLAPQPGELQQLGVRSPFLFYPAQFWSHKNHVVLLHALRLLVERHDLDLQLVFTGSDKGNLSHVKAEVERLGLAERVRFLGFVERRLVAALYREALALVFPSFFGPDNLPPLEAFALGCPALVAAVPGSEELYGDAAVLIDPKDEVAWAEAIRRLLDDARRRDELRERGLARGRQSTAGDYIGAIVARLDAFESVRRCWSRPGPFVRT